MVVGVVLLVWGSLDGGGSRGGGVCFAPAPGLLFSLIQY